VLQKNFGSLRQSRSNSFTFEAGTKTAKGSPSEKSAFLDLQIVPARNAGLKPSPKSD